MAEKVVVGLSGGVDSSVAALLLKRQGYDVIGVTMRIWQQEDAFKAKEGAFKAEEQGDGSGPSAVDDARRVAEHIGIPYYVLDFREEFRTSVIDYFMKEYTLGRTPNPCVVCNRYVKWEALLSRAVDLGADYIATGHYARRIHLANGRYAVLNSVTAEKDQTYALYNLTQQQLAHTLFPNGDYTKPEIRALAEEAGLPVAHKADSQEICFIPDGDYAGFIEKNSGYRSVPGNFVTESGTVLGKHKGIIHYTVGQRRGLDLPMGRRVFVTGIRPETNEVVVGEGSDVYTDHLVCDHMNWMAIEDLPVGEEIRAKVKIRYGHRGAMATVRRICAEQAECCFDEPVRAVTPGQAAVFYEGEYLLGGGTINSK